MLTNFSLHLDSKYHIGTIVYNSVRLIDLKKLPN